MDEKHFQLLSLVFSLLATRAVWEAFWARLEKRNWFRHAFEAWVFSIGCMSSLALTGVTFQLWPDRDVATFVLTTFLMGSYLVSILLFTAMTSALVTFSIAAAILMTVTKIRKAVSNEATD